MRTTEITKSLIGTVIGAVQVNRPWKHENRSFECAAWSETYEALTGIYPVTLTTNPQRREELMLTATIDAVVTDDYFPSLWCGVAVSNKPYVPKHIGESRKIRITVAIAEAIERTGNSPGNDKDWFIDKKYWEAFITEAEASLKRLYADLPEWWNRYQEGEDQYDSRVGMVGHVASEIATIVKDIQTMRRHHKYQIEKTDSWRKYYDINTAWAAAINQPVQKSVDSNVSA